MVRRNNRRPRRGQSGNVPVQAIQAVARAMGSGRNTPRRRRNNGRNRNNRSRINRLEQNMAQQRGVRFRTGTIGGNSSRSIPVTHVEQWGDVTPGINQFTFAPRGCLPALAWADYHGEGYDAYTLVKATIVYQPSATVNEEGLLTYGIDYNGRTPINSPADLRHLSNYGAGRVYTTHESTINIKDARKGAEQLSVWTVDADPFTTEAFTFYINNPTQKVTGVINITWKAVFHSPNLASALSGVPSSSVFVDRVDDAAALATAADDGISIDNTKTTGNSMAPTANPSIVFNNGAPSGAAFNREWQFESAAAGQKGTFTTLPGKENVLLNGRIVQMPRTAAAHQIHVKYVDGGPVESDKYELTPITTAFADKSLIVGTHGQPRIIADILATGFNILKSITKPFVTTLVNSVYGPADAALLPAENIQAVLNKYGTLPSTIHDDTGSFTILADDTTVITPVISAFNDGHGTDIIIPAAEPTKREDTLTAAFDIRFRRSGGSTAWDSRDLEVAKGIPYTVDIGGEMDERQLVTINITPNPALTEPITEGDTFVFSGVARWYPSTGSYSAPVGLAFVDATEGWFYPLVINDGLDDSPDSRLSVRSMTVGRATDFVKFVYQQNHSSVATDAGYMIYSFSFTRTSVTKSVPYVEAVSAPTQRAGRLH